MKTILLFTIAAALASCVQSPIGDANPLDRPYDRQSAADLHEQNIEAITGFPYVKQGGK